GLTQRRSRVGGGLLCSAERLISCQRLTRPQLTLLFGRDVKTIGKHVSNALRGELEGESTVAKFAIVQSEGQRITTRLVIRPKKI
ncbi:MAG: hypothetical protein ACTIM8_13110, partial [Brevibacterium aurantiacum]